MLSFLLALISPATQIVLNIADFYELRLKAQTDVEKAYIDKAIQQMNDQRDVILASTNTSLTKKIYWTLLTLGALGPLAYILKVFLWDKTIGAFYGCSGVSGDGDIQCHIFNTDSLADPNLWWITVAVFGFLFLTSRK